ncbi:MAG TPA: hypothetical protein VGJ78_15285 [Vicinamibacterales bacterium]
MRDLLAWIEATGLGHWMRESGPWTYALVNTAHIIGVATLFGSVLALDLRLLGLRTRVRLADLASVVTPIGAAGFALAALTGAAMLATKATAYVDNPFLLVKFPAIALGLLNVGALNLTPAWRARGARELSRTERRQLAVFGGLSLASWLTAITCGRMIAFW